MIKKPILVSILILLFEIGFFPNLALIHSETQTPKSVVTKEVLDNGLMVLLKEETTHPVVTIRITLPAGLSQEDSYVGSGISHFVEHMIFKGTAKRKPGEIEREVKSFGGVINGSTGLDEANYYVTVPEEHFEEALELLEDALFHSQFDEKETEKEMEVILKEISLLRDDPARRVMKQLWQTAYIEHPYRYPIIGYKNLFKELRRPDLVNYHASRYIPNEMVLTIVGDIETEKAIAAVKMRFGHYKRKKYPLSCILSEPQQNSVREIRDSAEINLGYLAMGYHTVELSHNDLYALDVLSIILGRGDGSRLNKKLVKDTQLLYTVSAFNYTPKYPGLFIVYGIGDFNNLEDAQLKILDEIEKIKANGVNEGELEAAKNMVISSYIESLETTQGLASVIAQGQFLAGNALFFEKYVDNVKKIGAESVIEIARKYLRENNLTTSLLYPSYASGEKAIPQSKSLEKNAPKKIILPNGIRLILKEDHRLPKVSLVCAFLGGLRAEKKGINGVCNLTCAMLLKGTKNREESEIKPYVESMGAEIGHFSGMNTFGISVDFLSRDTDEILDILEDILKYPTFPKGELKKQKEKIYASIKAEDDDIYSAGFLKLKNALFKNHPYGMRKIGEIHSLEKIARRDVEDFYKKFCVTENMAISIVGDFVSDEMERKIKSRFADMRKTATRIEVATLEPLGAVKEARDTMERDQSVIFIGFRGTTFDSKARYSLEILSSILSGENGLLYESIRNAIGLSYSLGVFSTPGIDPGHIVAYAATDKEYLKQTKDILLRQLEKIRNGDFAEGEILLAKSSLIGRHKISLQTFGALAYQMVLGELYGVGYNAYENYPQIISGLTESEIKQVAKKYIDLDNCALVVISGTEND